MKISKIIIPTSYKDSYWQSPNWNDLREYILMSLGWPIIKVELTEEQLNSAIHSALIKYHDYSPLELNVTVATINDGGWVDIPDSVPIRLIRDVIFQVQGTSNFNATFDVLTSFASNESGIGVNIYQFNQFDVSAYAAMFKQLEDIKRTLGIDKHWEILNGKIKVYPSRLMTDSYTKIGILHGDIVIPEELETSGFMREYSTAKAKTMLGMVRRKFSGFSFAGGGGTSDGAELISEGKEEMEKLLENRKNDIRPPEIFQV